MMWIRLWSAMGTVLVLTWPALGQEVGAAPARAAWAPIVLAWFLVACVLVASFMSSRRGHRD